MDGNVITRLMVLLLIAAFAHNFFHEFGHWLVGTVLGNQMSMTLNGTWPTNGGYTQEWHSPVVGMSGPAFSILMASVALIAIEKSKTVYAFPFLFFPLFARAFALVFGGFAAQDEAGVSATLGLGRYTVAISVFSVLLGLVWLGSHKLRLDFKVIGSCLLGSVVGELMVIGTHRLLF